MVFFILSAEARRAVRSEHTAGVVLALGVAEELPPLDEDEPLSLLHAETPAPSTRTQQVTAVVSR